MSWLKLKNSRALPKKPCQVLPHVLMNWIQYRGLQAVGAVINPGGNVVMIGNQFYEYKLVPAPHLHKSYCEFAANYFVTQRGATRHGE